MSIAIYLTVSNVWIFKIAYNVIRLMAITYKMVNVYNVVLMILLIVYNVILIIIINYLLINNHVFVLMASSITQYKISVNHVLMVVKPVMEKDMINVLLVNLIQIHQYTSINKRGKISVF